MAGESRTSPRRYLWIAFIGFWVVRFFFGQEGLQQLFSVSSLLILVGVFAAAYVGSKLLDRAISYRYGVDDPGFPDEQPTCRNCGAEVTPNAARCGRCNTRDPVADPSGAQDD
ncbi:hypothetical protein ACFQH6_14255 [Halobacteriaceae archaeon GCM10025711]